MSSLKPSQVNQCERLLRELVVSQQGLEACLIASSDGFEVACVSRVMAFSPSRLSALSSSLQAVASAVLGEARCGDVAEIVIHGSQGRMVVHPLKTDRMLCLIASSDAAISSLRHHARSGAAELELVLSDTDSWVSRRM